MTDRDRFIKLCVKGLEDKGLLDARYKERLKLELKEIDEQADHQYFVDLVEKGVCFAKNDHNLLVAYLLNLCPHVDMEHGPSYAQGEFPDIDTDFLPKIAKYLKHEWAPKVFGEENTSVIAANGTMGIKQAVLSMAKVYGLPHDEVQAITKKIELKDNEGDPMEWDKALTMYPDFADYMQRNPEVADAAQFLISRRKVNNVHPGGLIISSKPLWDLVPIELRSIGSKENPQGVLCSAWGEGQRTQDLGPVGLVKFDILVVDDLLQIALACHLIHQRHGVAHISDNPGEGSWSNITYLNDPKALALANAGDTRFVFQLGSDGMRKMLRDGGVTSFDDIAAYSALYRPGPMGMKMHEAYCLRKKGRQKYHLHPLLQAILGRTFGVQVFQEQTMQILNRVGSIPLIHCEKVRKAISKKKLEEFAPYMNSFMSNGRKNLQCVQEIVENIWKEVESFADYGFNASHSYAYSYITARHLYLMAHYPLEFYASVLMRAPNADEIKAIKYDARSHGVDVCPIDINKSRINFEVVDDKIYFGFSNLVGLGEEMARRIVEGQPYESFEDFVFRFGHAEAVVRALIAIGAFGEDYNKLTLYKYFKYYKDWVKSHDGAVKRYHKTMEEYPQRLRSMLEENGVPADVLEKACHFTPEAAEVWKSLSHITKEQSKNYKGEVRTKSVTLTYLLEDLAKKRERSISGYTEKEEAAERPPTLKTFAGYRKPLDPKEEQLMTDEKFAEKTYYGFQWIHNLEESPDYQSFTIDRFDRVMAEEDDADAAPVEVEILEVARKDFKNGKGHSWNVTVEDANGKQIVIKFWSDDYERFQDDLVVGNLVRAKIKPPVPPFPGYTFFAPPRHERWKRLPKNKEDDFRLVVLRRGEPKKPKQSELEKEVGFELHLNKGTDEVFTFG
jgi:DNA polymerase III alpha subunit